MLGLPNCCEPVFMKICAGAWLNASVTIDLTIATSSTTSAKWGRQFRELDAGAAVLRVFELGRQQGRAGVDERRPVVLQELGGGQGSVELLELRLVVEEVEVARCPRLEEEDHALGLGREVRRLGRQRVARRHRARGRLRQGPAQ
jgi:hypothetical protein